MSAFEARCIKINEIGGRTERLIEFVVIGGPIIVFFMLFSWAVGYAIWGKAEKHPDKFTNISLVISIIIAVSTVSLYRLGELDDLVGLSGHKGQEDVEWEASGEASDVELTPNEKKLIYAKIAKTINESLPKRVSPEFIWVSSHYDKNSNTFFYNYAADSAIGAMTKDEISLASSYIADLVESVGVCNSINDGIRESLKEVNVRSTYHDSNGNELFNLFLSRGSCQ